MGTDRMYEELEFWKRQAVLYERMFMEQKEICDGYRRIIEDQEYVIRNLNLNKSLDKKIAKSECI